MNCLNFENVFQVYVADLTEDKSGHRIHKFMLNGLKPLRTSGLNN